MEPIRRPTVEKRPGARGRVSGSRPLGERDSGEIAVAPTLRAAALSATKPPAAAPSDTGKDAGLYASHGHRVDRQDLRETLRRDESGRLTVLVVDCSDSMGLERRISAAKGAALSLLARSRVTGDRVAVISFRDRDARTVVPPTTSVYRARNSLAGLSVGGATPLAAGLARAIELLAAERRVRPRVRPTVVLMTDGEANVPLNRGDDLDKEILAIGSRLRGLSARFIVLHTGDIAIERMRGLAGTGEYHHAGSFLGEEVSGLVNAGDHR